MVQDCIEVDSGSDMVTWMRDGFCDILNNSSRIRCNDASSVANNVVVEQQCRSHDPEQRL